MLYFPNAKINLGLYVQEKRKDGFHHIETCFLPVPVHDLLEINSSDKTQFVHTGIPISTKENLTEKAWRLLKELYPEKLNSSHFYLHLHKLIPIGAGLGGGSADASFTLNALNQLFGIGATNDELVSLAARIGSDCPFFLENKPLIATGTGNIFSPVQVQLSSYFFLLVVPPIHVSTPWAYGKVIPEKRTESLSSILSLPISQWQNLLMNDFEIPVFREFPLLRNLKESLYEMGAIYASMSGSGSALYGIFKRKPTIPDSYSGFFTRIFQIHE